MLGRGAIVYTDDLVLPESFKWQGKRLHQPRLTAVEKRFARFRTEDSEPEALSGSFFFFDYAHPGHYGHLLTEGIARLWGWHQAKQQDPELRLLLRHHRHAEQRTRVRPDIAVLSAFGVADSDLTWISGPVRVETLFGATPMWHNNPPFYAHPGMVDVWRDLREGFAKELLDTTADPTHERIFVTRHEGNRPCRNVEVVERIFIDHGFTIIRPGSLTPAQQARAFSRARVVAGFGGTGMFNILYAEELQDVIVLNHTAYEARNEHMMAALCGANLRYFWSAPDANPDEVGYYEAFQSGWEFDERTNAEALSHLLKKLDSR